MQRRSWHWESLSCTSVHLDYTVDFIYKPEAGKETDGTCEEEEDEDHDHGIAKIEKGAGCSYDLQLGEEVMDSVDEQVDRREATGQERAPPPVVVLCT